MAQVVLGSSPDASTVAYASMASTAPLDDKTSAVFQAQPKFAAKTEEGKEDPTSILTQANGFLEKGNSAYEERNYHAAYLHYLSAKNLYEKLPKDTSALKKLIQVNYDLAWAAMEIRKSRRTTAYYVTVGTAFFWLGGIFCLPCCVSNLKSSPWVNNQTFRSYIDGGLRLIDDCIQTIQEKNGISMGTEKNTVVDSVRKELGWAYSRKAYFYNLDDPVTLGNFNNPDVLSDCCFEGTDGKHDASRYNVANALANLKLAKEWDPSNQTYESDYQKLDASMKRPVVNVYYE